MGPTSPLFWSIVATCLLAGMGSGWLLRSRRPRHSAVEWQTRLTARDRDVARAQEESADLAVALQRAEARITELMQAAGTDEEPDATRHAAEAERQAARADALADRLRAAEAEIAGLRNREVAMAGTGGTDDSRRVEELEAEVAALETRLCPDPDAHAAHPEAAPIGTREA